MEHLFKRFVSILAIGFAVAVLYSGWMYGYVLFKFRPITPLIPSQPVPAVTWALQNPFVFLHQVNSPVRAQRKDTRFGGYEMDILARNGNIYVGHDEKQIREQITLSDILQSIQRPQDKYYWLDIKTELTDDEINTLLSQTARFGISPEHLLFELQAGKTAQRIKAHHLLLLLQLPDGFEQDHNDPALRARHNNELAALIRQYEPAALSASCGKYGLLRAYFPDYPKAIYYSITKRPSLKKYFMRKQLEKDPSVKIFLLEEYTYL